ncbi:glycosyltransferase family 4 protein [Amnibacterium sp.]|uniref:glycosyltransferase family 4 protein n=1 Tax=Amnibacterium sp. TaxID=1872496 RepID=UPI0026291E20|nr:glycosyltransferase [Amnibacterium sp.]MCU1474518.1 glycosyl transferase group 1 [Amnibacterium sp.]
MSPVAFLVPAGVQDSRHPSGGNRYDVELAGALRLAGWRAQLVELDAEEQGGDAVLAGRPSGEPVLVDGLLLERDAVWDPRDDHRLVPLLHMPPAAGAAYELLGRLDTVVTTSAWTRDRIRGRLPASTSIVVALPGVRPTRLVATSPTGRRIRCVGALAPHKGQDVLLAALGRIRHLPWRCELVGATDVDPGFTRRIHRLAADLGIADRVVLTGPRHANPVDGLYTGADVLVLPSRTESYGMVAAEALACGVPVIATDTGGVREAIDPTAGLLVRPDDPAALAAALGVWLSRTDLRRRLTAAARQGSSHRRSWSSTAGIVADVLAAAPVTRLRTSGW